MESLLVAPAHQLATLIRQRQVSASEVVEAYLAQIARHNAPLNAVVTVDEDGAWQRARAADAALATGHLWGPLHGVPLTLKDVHDTAGLRSTMGQAALLNRIATDDSIVAARLKAAGSVLLGKTNAELAPDNPFGQTRSPCDLDRSPGISSSGAAAALAAGMTALDIGSDVGGSIIEPAHSCAVCGMRPTERRVPLSPVAGEPIRLWRTMQVLGPLARSVQDLRVALQLIAGPHRLDSEVPPVTWRPAPRLALSELRIAWTATFPSTHIAADIRAALEAFAHELTQRGGRVQQCLPEVDLVHQAQALIRLTELVEGAFAGPPPSLGAYFTAPEQRDRCIAHWEQFFEAWDVLICPAAEITAPHLTDTVLVVDGTEVPPGSGVAPHQLSPATGQPAIVMPLAHDQHGLPIGVQLIGRRWDDERLLAIAELLADVTGGFQPPPGY